MRHKFDHVSDLPAGFWRWPHIDAAREWADRMSGTLVVVPEFLDLIEQLRASCGFALPITSGYRTPEHNAVVSTTGKAGPHTTARAVDIQVAQARAFELVKIAYDLGFTGIGWQQSQTIAPGRRFIHLDNLTQADGFPRPGIWSY